MAKDEYSEGFDQISDDRDAREVMKIAAAPDFDGAISEFTEPDWANVDWDDEVYARMEGRPSLFDRLDEVSAARVAAAWADGGHEGVVREVFSDPEGSEDDFQQGDPNDPLGDLQAQGEERFEDASPEVQDAVIDIFDGDIDAAADHYEAFGAYSVQLAESTRQEALEAGASPEQAKALGDEAADEAVEEMVRVGPAMWSKIMDRQEEIFQQHVADGHDEDTAASLANQFGDSALETGSLAGAQRELDHDIEQSNAAAEQEALDNPYVEVGHSDRASGTGVPTISKQTARGVMAGNPRDTLRAELVGFASSYSANQRERREGVSLPKPPEPLPGPAAGAADKLAEALTKSNGSDQISEYNAYRAAQAAEAEGGDPPPTV